MDFNIALLNYFRQRNRGYVLSLLAIASFIYLPFFGNPFVFDDLNFIFGITAKYYTTAISEFDLRWLPNATLAWTQAVFYDMPHVYRLGNLLLHATNVILLFFLLRQFSLLVIPAQEKKHLSWGAWLGALFFACNPVAVYAVGYMIQRSILMATLFTLAMQLAYLRGLLCEQKFGQKLWLTLSVIFYFFAVFSKEQSLVAPAIIFITTYLLRPYTLVDKRVLWITWFGYLAIGIIVVLRIKGILGSVYEFDAPELFQQLQMSETSTTTLHVLSLLTQAGLFFKYLFLWLLPNPGWMSVDMREVFASSLWAWQNWLGVIGFILYGALAARLLVQRGWAGLAGLALLYPWLFFMVEFSVIRIQEPFVLYRSYLWVPGLMLFFPILINTLSNRKIAMTALTIITLSLVPLSWNRLWVFSDSYRLWNDAALLLPDEHASGAARIYYNRGNAELVANLWSKAIADFHRVKATYPEIAQVYINIGRAYSGLNQYQEAINNFDQAIALKPDYADAFYNKGMVLKRLHSNKEALANMRTSCGLGNQTACVIVAFQNRPD